MMIERLTEYDEYGNADIIGVDSAELQLNLEFDELNRVTDALNRLAAYEDSGLSPEEIKIQQKGREDMKTLSEWKEKMMEEVEGTVFVFCIMYDVPHHPGTRRYQVYNEEGTFNQTFDITLDANNNITHID